MFSDRFRLQPTTRMTQGLQNRMVSLQAIHVSEWQCQYFRNCLTDLLTLRMWC